MTTKRAHAHPARKPYPMPVTGRDAPVIQPRKAAPTPAAPTDLLDDLRRGRLSQHCPAPACGIAEAAGSYCTRCETATGPADWYRPAASDAQRAHLREARAIQSGGDRPQPRAEQEQSAPPAIPARAPTTVAAA